MEACRQFRYIGSAATSPVIDGIEVHDAVADMLLLAGFTLGSLGVNDLATEGTWTWADGSRVDSRYWNAGEPITFHRSPLRVDIDIPPQSDADTTLDNDAYRLTLYVVHAKSGGPGEYWRLSEARGLANQIKLQLAAEPDANIAVLGDFNAFLSDESVQALIESGLTDALAAVADRSPRFVTHESGRRIDHILVNANLHPELVPASPFILGTPSLPEGLDWRQEWRPDGYASDHFPVTVELTPIDK